MERKPVRWRLSAAIVVTLAVSAPAKAAEPRFPLTGEVVDASTGEPLPARVYLRDEAGSWLFPESASAEGSAVRYEKQNWINNSSVEMHTTLSAHPFRIDLAPGRYRLEVERGKEYHTLEREVEVRDGPVRVKLPLRRWVDMASLGWYSGDTHVHRSVDELPNVLLAEDLNVAFPLVYWVTRSATPPSAGDKSSRVPERELIPVDATHVISTRNTEYEIFTVGERRHTLGAFFALHHGAAFEVGVPPVRPVAAEAHLRGALLDLDKHDWPWSIALVPIAGIDLFELANNHMWRTEFAFRTWSTPAAPYMELPGEGRSGEERDWILYGLRTYYALLDCGFRLRPTAGTASGVHPVPLGFSRVYVLLEEPFTFEGWFRGLGAGRSFVTTGPMLLVTANGKPPGATLLPGSGGKLEVDLQVKVIGAEPTTRLEIVMNGEVVKTLPSANRRTEAGAHESSAAESLAVGESGWLAVRAFEDRPGGRVRFAHTGPFHLQVPGSVLRPSRAEAEFLVRRVRDEIARSTGVLPPEAIEEYESALEAFEEIAETAR